MYSRMDKQSSMGGLSIMEWGSEMRFFPTELMNDFPKALCLTNMKCRIFWQIETPQIQLL